MSLWVLKLCPICVKGPVVRRGKSRMGGLLTKARFECLECGSVFEPVGSAYRYRKISSEHPEMRSYLKTLFRSLDELQELAWKRARESVDRELRAADE